VSDDVLWLGHAIIAIYRDFSPNTILPPEHTSRKPFQADASRPGKIVIPLNWWDMTEFVL
jgi:hypothetical protein